MCEEPECVAFFSHHKCATRWVRDILHQVAVDTGRVYQAVFRESDFPDGLHALVKRKNVGVLCYIDSDYAHVRALRGFRGFHVVRDPRDICVSAYFSHRDSYDVGMWPELAQHQERLRSLPREEGLLEDMLFIQPMLERMGSWDYNNPNIFEIRMEDLTRDPYTTFLQVFQFLGILDQAPLRTPGRLSFSLFRMTRRLGLGPVLKALCLFPSNLSAERALGILWEHRFEEKSQGRTKGSEDRSSHYRKGVPGDWQRHFGPKHHALFEELYGPLAAKLGYGDVAGAGAADRSRP